MTSVRLSPTWYDYQLQSIVMCHPMLPMKSRLSQELPQQSFQCSPLSSLPTPPTHLSVNRDVRVRFHVHSFGDVPSILSTLPPEDDKATSKLPANNVHPHRMTQLMLSLPNYVRPFLRCRHGWRVVLSSNSKLAAEKLCNTTPRSECTFAFPHPPPRWGYYHLGQQVNETLLVYS